MMTCTIIAAFIKTQLSQSSSDFHRLFPAAFAFHTNPLKLIFKQTSFPKSFSNDYIEVEAQGTNSACCILVCWCVLTRATQVVCEELSILLVTELCLLQQYSCWDTSEEIFESENRSWTPHWTRLWKIPRRFLNLRNKWFSSCYYFYSFFKPLLLFFHEGQPCQILGNKTGKDFYVLSSQ